MPTKVACITGLVRWWYVSFSNQADLLDQCTIDKDVLRDSFKIF